jgi:hypothetical protein
MKSLTTKLILGLLLSLLFTLPSLSQSDKQKGFLMIEQNSTINPFTLSDQFGKEHTLSTLPQLLICSFGKETGKLISSYFNAQEADYLAKNDIKLIADVSSVPSLLRSTFILPKMKKYSFEILISTQSDFSDQFPRKEDELTVLKLENGVVESITFVGNKAGLKESIEG